MGVEAHNNPSLWLTGANWVKTWVSDFRPGSNLRKAEECLALGDRKISKASSKLPTLQIYEKFLDKLPSEGIPSLSTISHKDQKILTCLQETFPKEAMFVKAKTCLGDKLPGVTAPRNSVSLGRDFKSFKKRIIKFAPKQATKAQKQAALTCVKAVYSGPKEVSKWSCLGYPVSAFILIDVCCNQIKSYTFG